MTGMNNGTKRVKAAHALNDTTAGPSSALLEGDDTEISKPNLVKEEEEKNPNASSRLKERDLAPRDLIKMNESNRSKENSKERDSVPKNLINIRIPYGKPNKFIKLELDPKDLIPNPTIISKIHIRRGCL